MKIKILKDLVFNTNGKSAIYSTGDILELPESESKTFSANFPSKVFWEEYIEPVTPQIRLKKLEEEALTKEREQLSKERQEFEAEKIAFQKEKAEFEKQLADLELKKKEGGGDQAPNQKPNNNL